MHESLNPAITSFSKLKPSFPNLVTTPDLFADTGDYYNLGLVLMPSSFCLEYFFLCCRHNFKMAPRFMSLHTHALYNPLLWKVVQTYMHVMSLPWLRHLIWRKWMDLADVIIGPESVDFWVNWKGDYFRWIGFNQEKVLKRGNGPSWKAILFC